VIAEPPASELFAGPAGAELAKRVIAATGEARELCGHPAGAPAAADPEDPGLLIAALAELAGGAGAQIDAHRAAIVALRARYEKRIEALERIHATGLGLARFGSPHTLLERAPRELVEGSDFEHAVLSVIRAGVSHAVAVWIHEDPRASVAALAALGAAPVRLAHPTVEAELVRMRRATVVNALPGTDRPHSGLAAVMGWHSYAATAVFVRARPVALIHAARGPAQDVEVLDRDVLWEFAAGFAAAYDGSGLAAALRRERAAMIELAEWLDARAGDLRDASLDFVGRAPALLAGTPRRGGPTALLDDRLVFDGRLTRREIEVLRLLVAGRSNRAIGEDLVLSAGTVKFHVNSILRKLGVANRAEAVASYLRLTGALEI